MSKYRDCHLISMPIVRKYNSDDAAKLFLDIAAKFFFYFARFEYAMRVADYWQRDDR